MIGVGNQSAYAHLQDDSEIQSQSSAEGHIMNDDTVVARTSVRGASPPYVAESSHLVIMIVVISAELDDPSRGLLPRS